MVKIIEVNTPDLNDTVKLLHKILEVFRMTSEERIQYAAKIMDDDFKAETGCDRERGPYPEDEIMLV
jgi:hypothetical protein